MRFQRTQIYLDPEEHRRLGREASERGLSLTEYLRRVIGNRAGEQRAPYDTRSWDGIFDITNSKRSDSAEAMDEEAADAFEAEHRRSLNRRTNQRTVPKAAKSARP